MNTKTNYWTLLYHLNIRYGRDVVIGHDPVNGSFVRCLEFRGKLYRTAKEIYEAVTSK